MAVEKNPVFDQSIPSPSPITLTFGEEGAPEINESAAAPAVETGGAPTPTDAANAALSQAQDALAQAETSLTRFWKRPSHQTESPWRRLQAPQVRR